MIPRDAQARYRLNAATDAVTVSTMIAAAMRRLMLPNDSMRITIRYSKNGTHTTVTVPPTYLSRPAEYSPVDPARLDQAAADFTLIDKCAITWGSRGNHRHHTMWAVLSQGHD